MTTNKFIKNLRHTIEHEGETQKHRDAIILAMSEFADHKTLEDMDTLDILDLYEASGGNDASIMNAFTRVSNAQKQQKQSSKDNKVVNIEDKKEDRTILDIHRKMAQYFQNSHQELANGEGYDFKPGVLAKLVLKEQTLLKDERSTGTYYIYDEKTGIWNIDSANKGILKNVILNEYFDDLNITNSRLNNVYSLIIPQIKLAPEGLFPQANEDIIVLNNGVYNVKERNFTEKGFDPDFYATARCSFDYDPSTTCPTYDRLLEFMFDDPKDRDFVNEWLGYSLMNSYPQGIQKFLLLTSDAGYGKSQLIKIFQAVIGRDSYSTVPLDVLNDTHGVGRFAMSELYRRTANFDSDAKVQYLSDGALLKRMTGEDTIFADVKNAGGFSFVNTAKMTISTNKLPTMNDIGGSLARRAVILRLTKPLTKNPENLAYVKEHCNTDYIIKNEIQGVFNRALEGLFRLYENGSFTQSETSKAHLNEWLAFNDPVEQFLSDETFFLPQAYVDEVLNEPQRFLNMIFKDEKLQKALELEKLNDEWYMKTVLMRYKVIPKNDLYNIYKAYTHNNNQKPMSKKNLWTLFEEHNMDVNLKTKVKPSFFDHDSNTNKTLRGVEIKGILNPLVTPYLTSDSKKFLEEVESLNLDNDPILYSQLALALDLYIDTYLNPYTRKGKALINRLIKSKTSFNAQSIENNLKTNAFDEDLDDVITYDQEALQVAKQLAFRGRIKDFEEELRIQREKDSKEIVVDTPTIDMEENPWD